jgi:hypothetical protein
MKEAPGSLGRRMSESGSESASVFRFINADCDPDSDAELPRF